MLQQTTKLEGLIVRRKLTGELFTITGKDQYGFFLLDGGADNGGRDVLGSELNYYERVSDSPASCACGGTGWVTTRTDVWTQMLFRDIRQTYANHALGFSTKPCLECDSRMVQDDPHVTVRGSFVQYDGIAA